MSSKKEIDYLLLKKNGNLDATNNKSSIVDMESTAKVNITMPKIQNILQSSKRDRLGKVKKHVTKPTKLRLANSLNVSAVTSNKGFSRTPCKSKVKEEDIKTAKLEQKKLRITLAKEQSIKDTVEKQHTELHNKEISIEAYNNLNKLTITKQDQSRISNTNNKEVLNKQHTSNYPLFNRQNYYLI